MSSCSRFKDKVVVVTASSEGIGYAIADRICQEGGKVVISSRKQANVDKALQTLQRQYGERVAGIVCHVGDMGHRQELLEFTAKTFGQIDVLISNAAVNPEVCPILDMSEKAIDKILDINIKSATLLVKEAIPYMNKQKSNIIFISSIAGYRPQSLLGMYSVSKTALLGLTKALAQELVPYKIRVNCVAPGTVRTKFAGLLTNTEVEDKSKSMIPMHRFGQAEEIAAAVAFLASDDASYITGETIPVAGGILSRL